MCCLYVQKTATHKKEVEMYTLFSGVVGDCPQGPHGSVFIALSHQDASQAELSFSRHQKHLFSSILSLTPALPSLPLSFLSLP